jgi:phage anti-repressor protein
MTNSKELVKIGMSAIGGEPTSVVDARELHTFLNVGRDFSNWIKDRITKYGFEEGKDFEKVLLKFGENPQVVAKSGENPQGGRPTIEYTLTIDMAKELGMVESNEKGRLIRRYFIEVEKERRHSLAALPDPEDVLRREIYGLMETVGEKGRIYNAFAIVGLSQPYIKYWLDKKKPLTPEKLATVRSRVDYLRRLYSLGFALDSHLIMAFETNRPDELRELVRPEMDATEKRTPLFTMLSVLYGICLDFERLMYYDYKPSKHESL